MSGIKHRIGELESVASRNQLKWEDYKDDINRFELRISENKKESTLKIRETVTMQNKFEKFFMVKFEQHTKELSFLKKKNEIIEKGA